MRADSREPSDPVLTSDALAAIAAAFRRRAKAIAYKAAGLEFTRELEGDGHERFNVDAVIGGTQVRLSLWADRSLWYRACQAGPRRAGGWEFLLAFSGNAADVPPEELVDMFERSLTRAHEKDPIGHSEEILSRWERVGPIVERSGG